MMLKPRLPKNQPGKPERTFLLSRFRDGVEEAVGDDKDEVMDIVMHYRHLVSMRIKKRANSLPMSHFAGQIGSILFHFFPSFPDSELPLAGGISEFEYQGYEFRFDTDGARAVETINFADHLHSLGLCKPLLCIEPKCPNYSMAVDDRIILPHNLTYFLRYAPKYNRDPNLKSAVPTKDPIYFPSPFISDKILKLHGRKGIEARRPLTADEFLFDERFPLEAKEGLLMDEDRNCWEVMPAPPDASQLDMHLAQLSSLDTRYVLLFTSEVKHMFDDTMHRKYDDLEDESDESDEEDAYVESALVPGLQQRDFNRVIDLDEALSGLTLDGSDFLLADALINKKFMGVEIFKETE